MNKNFKRDFDKLKMTAPQILRSQTPYRTGNLRSTIRMNQINNNSFEILIGGEQAPYVVYVNEPWISPIWRGRENPREGFIGRAAELMVRHIETNMNMRRM